MKRLSFSDNNYYPYREQCIALSMVIDAYITQGKASFDLLEAFIEANRHGFTTHDLLTQGLRGVFLMNLFKDIGRVSCGDAPCQPITGDRLSEARRYIGDLKNHSAPRIYF